MLKNTKVMGGVEVGELTMSQCYYAVTKNSAWNKIKILMRQSVERGEPLSSPTEIICVINGKPTQAYKWKKMLIIETDTADSPTSIYNNIIDKIIMLALRLKTTQKVIS